MTSRCSLPPPGDDELGDLVNSLDTLRNQLAARMAELRGEGHKLRAIINGMSEGVALVQDGVIAVANPAFGRPVGLGGDAEGRAIRDAVRVPAVGDAIEQPRSPSGAPASREVQVAGRALVATINPLGDAPARQAVVVLIDVTEPKRLERLRREFVANASHELRTPVAAIVGVAETLAAGAADNPEARSSFLEILDAPRAAALAPDRRSARHRAPRGRLQAARRRWSRSRPPSTPCSVHCRSRREPKTITLEEARADGLSACRPSAPPSSRCSPNLVDNAIKYTPAGGQVTVRAEARGGRVRIIVEDTGPGIPKEHHARLFERFYRVDDARSRERRRHRPRPRHRQAPGAGQRRRRRRRERGRPAAAASSFRCRKRYESARDAPTPTQAASSSSSTTSAICARSLDFNLRQAG